MKTTLVTTILNEEKTIKGFLKSISHQSILPDEVIIVDGGSTDKTIQKIEEFIKKNGKTVPIKVIQKKGNRSVGRNEGIKRAQGDIIAISDAGCILDKDWVKEIVKPFSDKSVDVVAGYYADASTTTFQKCMVPYVFVMPDKVHPDTFLPATRSMAIKKKVWEELGGFDPKYSHNEDYVFARKLRDSEKKIFFARDAIVYWIPRKNLKEAFIMFYRFAFGDIEATIIRLKVVILFARYLLALVFLLFWIISRNLIIIFILLFTFALYTVWAIVKNYRYVKRWQAFYLLPMLQFISDIAILSGTLVGVIKHMRLLKKSLK